MTSLFMISSALEVGLVIAASAIFVAMVISAVALITWFVAGIVSASHPPVGALRRNEESA